MSKLQPRSTVHGMPLYQPRDRYRGGDLAPATRDMGFWESTAETSRRTELQSEGIALHDFVGFGSAQTEDNPCSACELPYGHRIHQKGRVPLRDQSLVTRDLPDMFDDLVDPEPSDQSNHDLRREPTADDLHVVTVFRMACTLPDCAGWQCEAPKHPKKQIRYSLEVERPDLTRETAGTAQDYDRPHIAIGGGRYILGESLRTQAIAKREPNWDSRQFPSRWAVTTFGARPRALSAFERRFPGLRAFQD